MLAELSALVALRHADGELWHAVTTPFFNVVLMKKSSQECHGRRSRIQRLNSCVS